MGHYVANQSFVAFQPLLEQASLTQFMGSRVFQKQPLVTQVQLIDGLPWTKQESIAY
jgi:hypothetical protein